MEIVSKIRASVPFLRGKPLLSRKEAMAVLPIRNDAVKWSKSDDEITLFIPMRAGRTSRFVERFLKVPDTKQLVLDDVGSAVWELCDGKNDIARIVREVCSRYKLSRREAEASVAAFFKLLAQKRLIGLVPGGKRKG